MTGKSHVYNGLEVVLSAPLGQAQYGEDIETGAGISFSEMRVKRLFSYFNEEGCSLD